MSAEPSSLKRSIIIAVLVKLAFIALLWLLFFRGHLLPAHPDRLLNPAPSATTADQDKSHGH